MVCGQAPCADPKGSVQGQHPPLEVADIIRTHRAALEEQYAPSGQVRAILTALARCRTAALGGHLDRCKACGYERPSYNSCHNRHCPKCPAVDQAKWIAGRLNRVLPTHYFHVVFTLPSELRQVAHANKSLVYTLLLQCAAETLLQLARDPKRLGAQLGVTAVLHTWARDLSFHPHAHCIVTGGGLNDDGTEWIAAEPDYLFPGKVLAKLFRGKLLDGLHRAHQDGKLNGVAPKVLRALLSKLYRTEWVVYCKRPFGGPEQVIRYLGHYTHRVAISNQRLIAMDESGVTFRTRGTGSTTLDGVTFLHRLSQHFLPSRFVKIRHYGLHSPPHVKTRLAIARKLLLTSCSPLPSTTSAACTSISTDAPICTTPPSSSSQSDSFDSNVATWREVIYAITGIDVAGCPQCGSHALERLPLQQVQLPQPRPP